MNEITGNDPDAATPARLEDDVAQLVRKAGPRPRMSSVRVARMREDLRPLWQEEVETPRRAVPLRLVAAAALVIVAIAAAWLSRGRGDLSTAPFATVARVHGVATAWSSPAEPDAQALRRGSSLRTGSTIATSEGGRVALTTADGHSLRLDRATRVALVGEREVRLEQGAVYVDSGPAGASTAGLVVTTVFARVTEIGTQFEVRLAADALTVRIREGEVVVTTGQLEERGEAGEELTLANGAVRRRRVEPHDEVFSWMQGIAPVFTLDGSQLDDFLEWVAHESGLELRFAEPGLATEAAAVRLSGEIEGLSPGQALDVVLPAVGLAHRIESGALLIRRRDGEEGT